MNTKRVLFILLFSATGWLGLSQSAETPIQHVMKFKLYFAQNVLEGITAENYDLIAANAAKLKELSQQEGWRVRQTPEYQRYTADFTNCADALASAAQKKNVDAATVAYFQLTVSCVNCHRSLREKRDANLRHEDISRPLPFKMLRAK